MISDSPQEELEYIQQPDMQILVQPGSLADRNDQSWQKQMTGLGLSKNWHKSVVVKGKKYQPLFSSLYS